MTGGAAGRANSAGRRRAVQLLSGGAIVVAAMAAAGVFAGLRINLRRARRSVCGGSPRST
jgi:hypothetical protein